MIQLGATYRATAIFSAAANLISQTGQSLDQPAFLRLYGHILERIHTALCRSETAEEEDIMLSIPGLMWFEAFYGSREQYRVHLNGLTAMATSPERSPHAAAVTLTEWTKANSADTTRSRQFMDSTRINEFDSQLITASDCLPNIWRRALARRANILRQGIPRHDRCRFRTELQTSIVLYAQEDCTSPMQQLQHIACREFSASLANGGTLSHTRTQLG